MESKSFKLRFAYFQQTSFEIIFNKNNYILWRKKLIESQIEICLTQRTKSFACTVF